MAPRPEADPLALLQVIRTLKANHPRLFLILCGDEPFIARPLTRAEWATIQSAIENPSEREEAICAQAVLYPAGIDWSKTRAGLPSALAPVILEFSGFATPEVPMAILERSRQALSSFEPQAETLIQAAFHVSLQELRSMDVYTFMDYLARAEWTLKHLYGIDQVIAIEPPKPPDMEQLRRDLRKQGADPMRLLPLPPDKPLVPVPFILGRIRPLSEMAVQALQVS